MIDRPKVKKMWVADLRKDLEENKYVRYVIVRNSDGSCLAVALTDEEEWEKRKGEVKLVYWRYCKEIPSEEYRPFKDEEITEEFFFFLFKRKNDGIIYRIQSMAPGGVKINGEWQTPYFLYKDWEIKRLMYRVISGHMAIFYPDEWEPAGVKV